MNFLLKCTEESFGHCGISVSVYVVFNGSVWHLDPHDLHVQSIEELNFAIQEHGQNIGSVQVNF